MRLQPPAAQPHSHRLVASACASADLHHVHYVSPARLPFGALADMGVKKKQSYLPKYYRTRRPDAWSDAPIGSGEELRGSVEMVCSSPEYPIHDLLSRSDSKWTAAAVHLPIAWTLGSGSGCICTCHSRTVGIPHNPMPQIVGVCIHMRVFTSCLPDLGP